MEVFNVRGTRVFLHWTPSSYQPKHYIVTPHPNEKLPPDADPDYIHLPPSIGAIQREEDLTWSYQQITFYVGDSTWGKGKEFVTRYAALVGLVEAFQRNLRGDWPGKEDGPKTAKVRIASPVRLGPPEVDKNELLGILYGAGERQPLVVKTLCSGEWADDGGFVDPVLQAVHESRVLNLQKREKEKELGLEIVQGKKETSPDE